MAALHAAFFTVLNPGDHAIVSNVVYMRVAGLFADVFPKKLGVEVDFVDITDLDAVRAAVRPNTKLVHTEVIANPDLRVADIAALATIAHEAGALLTIDSTFTPPPMMRPLDHGADLVIHSLTKYYNGHGDAMGGVVIGTPRPGREDPHRCDVARRWRDLPVQRLAHHARLHDPAAASAAAVRERAGGRGVPRGGPARRPCLVPGAGRPRPARRCPVPALRRVWWCRLIRHRWQPHRPADVRQRPARHHLRRLLWVTTRLWSRTRSTPKAPPKAFAQPFRDHGLVRLAIGLEAVEDLIADLDASLTIAYGPR